MNKIEALEIIHGMRAVLSAGAHTGSSFGLDASGNGVSYVYGEGVTPSAAVKFNFMGAFIKATGRRAQGAYTIKCPLEKIFDDHRPRVWWNGHVDNTEWYFRALRQAEKEVEKW